MTTNDEASENPIDAQTRGSTAAPHPEEMKGAFEFRLGRFASVTATARATPAGLVSAALLAAAVLLPLVWVMRRMRG